MSYPQSRAGGIETLDASTLNMQKIVDSVTQSFARFQAEIDDLTETLVKLAGFWATTTKKDETVLIQFTPEGQQEFKRYSTPISLAMYSVMLVVNHGRANLFTPVKIPEPTPQPEIQTKIEVNAKPEKESKLEKLKTLGKKLLPTEPSPYALSLDSFADLERTPAKWKNLLHWYNLACKKRDEINSREALQELLENITIVFDTFIEPNLLFSISYAKYIYMESSQDKATRVMESYQQLKQRNRQDFPSLPPNS